MSRQHFERLANELRYLKPIWLSPKRKTKAYFAELRLWERTVERIASTCGYFNGNFDRKRFYSACEYEGK